MATLSKQQTEIATLQQLKHVVTTAVDLQMRWVECGDRVDGDVAVQVWDRLHSAIDHAFRQPSAAQQLATLSKQLPSVVALMTSSVESPAKPSLPSPTPSPPPSADATSITQLTHQWIPRILSYVCASVERHATSAKCRPELAEATRRIVSIIQQHNPYAFFSLVYRAPPAGAEISVHSWVLRGSPLVQGMASIVDHDMDELDKIAQWMAAPEDRFWRSVNHLMVLVRRIAISFHHIMLHLYAIAMGREDPTVSVVTIRAEIHDAYAQHTSCELQMQAFGLAKWLKYADDPIVRETYWSFPEVLLYVDQWRHEHVVYEHGFEPHERARDYEIGVNRWKSSKSWKTCANHASRSVRQWRRAGLSGRHARESSFELSFERLGQLEKGIKHRLTELTNIFYKQNLAKWTQFRQNHRRGRILAEMRILSSDTEPPSSSATEVVDDQHPARAVPSVEHCDGHFRAPVRQRCPRPRQSNAPFDDDGGDLIDEESILHWTDEEIDAHEQETERIYELQSAMHSMGDKLSIPHVLAQSIPADPFDVDDQAALRAITTTLSKMRHRTLRAVLASEEIALHASAEALIQRPSLRMIQEEPPVEQVEAEVLDAVHHVQKLLAFEEEMPAFADAQQLAQGALAMLQQAQRRL